MSARRINVILCNPMGSASMNGGYGKQSQAVTHLLLLPPGTAGGVCFQCFGEILAHLPMGLAANQCRCRMPDTRGTNVTLIDWIPGSLSVARCKS